MNQEIADVNNLEEFNSDSQNQIALDNVENKRKHPALIIYVAFILIYVGLIIAPKTDFDNDWNKALTKFERAKTITDPNLRQQEFFIALKELNDLKNKYPYHGKLYLNSAYFYFTLGQLDSAIVNSYLALRIGGGGLVNSYDSQAIDIFLRSTLNKATYFFQRGDTISALNTFKFSHNLLPNNPVLSRIIGNYYAMYGNLDSAKKYTDLSYIHNPKDIETLYNYALIYKRQGKLDTALIIINTALNSNPKHEQFHKLLEQINSKKNEKQ